MDTKIVKRIKNLRDSQQLQSIIDNLSEWAKKWQMYFNVDKCKILHVGRQNPRFSYFKSGAQLQTTDSEKDHGIMIDETGKSGLQCAKAAKKGNQVLGQLLRSIHCRDKDTLIQLYKVFVRPHLEYCCNLTFSALKRRHCKAGGEAGPTYTI